MVNYLFCIIAYVLLGVTLAWAQIHISKINPIYSTGMTREHPVALVCMYAFLWPVLYFTTQRYSLFSALIKICIMLVLSYFVQVGVFDLAYKYCGEFTYAIGAFCCYWLQIFLIGLLRVPGCVPSEMDMY